MAAKAAARLTLVHRMCEVRGEIYITNAFLEDREDVTVLYYFPFRRRF